MDLYLANSAGQIIAQSAAGGSDESVTVDNPPAGTYRIVLDYWNGAEGDTAVVPTHIWTVTGADAGNMSVTPESTPAVISEPVQVTVEWADLAADSRYLGSVNYSDGTETIGKTLVSVVTGAPAAQ
jgi:hypothetical protein